jgi:hypothetical protein
LATLCRPGTPRMTSRSIPAPRARKRAPPPGLRSIPVASRSTCGCRIPGGGSSAKRTTRWASLPGRRTSAPVSSAEAGAANAAKAPESSASEVQREWWSSSRLVIAPTSGRSRRKLASLSSASATTHSPSPQPALLGAPFGPAPASSPPRKNAGSAPVARSAQMHIAAVVVLPWVPATASSLRRPQSSASSSPRWITGWPRSLARRSSGLSSGTAVETTTSASAGTRSASCPSLGSIPAVRSRSR